MGYSKDHPVYTKLRSAISSGDIPSGTHLKIGTLSNILRTSTAPLREALARLAAEDLVQYNFSHGYTVRIASFTEISDIFSLMELIILDGLTRLDSGDIDKLESLELHLSTNGSSTIDSTDCDFRNVMILAPQLQQFLFSPVGERQFMKLSILILPFQVATMKAEHPDLPYHDLTVELLARLRTGDLPQAIITTKKFFSKRRETLPFFFQAYEHSQRSAPES